MVFLSDVKMLDRYGDESADLLNKALDLCSRTDQSYRSTSCFPPKRLVSASSHQLHSDFNVFGQHFTNETDDSYASPVNFDTLLGESHFISPHLDNLVSLLFLQAAWSVFGN